MQRMARRRDHHLYAVQFDNGTVKIGRSLHPKVRLQSLANSHRKQGVVAIRFWVSEPMKYADCLDIEYALKERGADRWAVAHGTEYFAGVALDEVTAVAAELTKQLLDPSAVAYATQRYGLRRLRRLA